MKIQNNPMSMSFDYKWHKPINANLITHQRWLAFQALFNSKELS